MIKLIDKYGRKIDYLRLSLTNKCNLSCIYCRNKEDSYNDDVLDAQEIINFVGFAINNGIKKIKLTGGEPLLRKDFEYILKNIRAFKEIESLTLTTNGVMLKDSLPILKRYSVNPINVSIDTLNSEIYEKITGCNAFNKVFEGIKEAIEQGFTVRINSVMLKGINDDPLPLVKLAENLPLSIRFIELMPIGMGKNYTGVSNNAVMKLISSRYGNLTKLSYKGNGPCVYYTAKGLLGNIGFISPLTTCFCESCSRLRLTSEGYLKPCLYFESNINIKGLDNAELAKAFNSAINKKPVGHKFGEEILDKEYRNMAQIGG